MDKESQVVKVKYICVVSCKVVCRSFMNLMVKYTKTFQIVQECFLKVSEFI